MANNELLVGINPPETPNADEKLLGLLDALQPAKSERKAELFSKAYPGIRRALARKVSTKDILESLAQGGLKLHPQKFREMMKAEEARRSESGEAVICCECGQELVIAKSSADQPQERINVD